MIIPGSIGGTIVGIWSKREHIVHIIHIVNWKNKRQRKKLNQHYLTQGWWSRHRWNQRGRWHHARRHRWHSRWPWSHWGQSHGWKWWWDPRRRHLERRKETELCPKQNILWTNHRLSLNPAASHFKKERMLVCQTLYI